MGTPWRSSRLLLVVLAALLVATVGVGAFLLLGKNTRTYTVPSGSMAPNYEIGEKVTVDLDAYKDEGPTVGDVIIFHPPAGAEATDSCGADHAPDQACPEPTPGVSGEQFMKRVAAGPGDRLRIEGGVPVVNDAPVLEDVLGDCRGLAECELPVEITVPPDHYFVIGDNVSASDDSRSWGPIPASSIVGEVTD